MYNKHYQLSDSLGSRENSFDNLKFGGELSKA
jgi:hypothetical protein